MAKLLAPIALSLLSLSLVACKPKAHDMSAPPASTAAVSGEAATPREAAADGGQARTEASFVSQDAFDVNKVPVAAAKLPPFPYLAYPDGTPEGFQFTDKADFDEAYVIAGNKLRKVEGRIEMHTFDLDFGNLSELAARRNYEELIKAMGGVKVNTVELRDLVPGFDDPYTALHDKLRFHQFDMKYATYLVRQPGQNIWIALMSTKDEIRTLVVAEQPMKQTIGFVTADAMQAALTSAGHVALYINFDTDKAGLRADGKPVVDEIAKLMQQDPSLKLTIEGHTDGSGDAKRNKALSQQRADAVVDALAAAGIAKERLHAVGLGDGKPVADNSDEAGRARNRRVELVKHA